VPAIVLEQVRAIEWGRTDLWEVNFPNNPISGFNGWIPATDYERPVAASGSGEIPTEFTPLLYPKPDGKFSPIVRMSLLDNEARSVLNYFVAWSNQQTSGGVQTPLAECARVVQFQLLNKQKNVIQSWTDQVFLVGEYKITGNSEAQIPRVKVTLAIATDVLALQS
jgi:hypothetical protein